MKKLTFIFGISALIFTSCLNSKVENSTTKDTITGSVQVVDTLKEKKTPSGSDRDAHGCIGSAGYTWSVLKNECIRTFEQDLQLTQKESKDSYTSFAAVIFNENKSKAEVFLAKGNPEILEQTSNKKGSMRWQKGNYELIEDNGFSLLENGKVIFATAKPKNKVK